MPEDFAEDGCTWAMHRNVQHGPFRIGSSSMHCCLSNLSMDATSTMSLAPLVYIRVPCLKAEKPLTVGRLARHGQSRTPRRAVLSIHVECVHTWEHGIPWPKHHADMHADIWRKCSHTGQLCGQCGSFVEHFHKICTMEGVEEQIWQ
jgi:hypothetical protein